MVGVFWFLSFQALGQLAAHFCFSNKRTRYWLGSILGSTAAIWLPIPFAFILGFTANTQWFSLTVGILLTTVTIVFSQRHHSSRVSVFEILPHPAYEHSLAPLFISLSLFLLLCTSLLISHTIAVGENGLYSGQCTYGDMCMHLGFITSLAVQGSFPPFYSIFPSAKLCYPFLCDSISASLYILGSSLRLAYIFPMLFALAQVFCGVWFLAEEFCKQKGGPLLSCTLFFLNGGFGLYYFLNGDYSFRDLFFGYYNTPTNLTNAGIRWVNIIADMLIPQRATLFGWSILFACLWMLYRAVFCCDSRLWLPAGILGGLLPMIHTHSYFALGLTAFCWLLWSLHRDTLHWHLLRGWMRFGLPAVVLAIPQLIEWTFQSVGGNSQFLRIGIDWVNGLQENWFLFWFKNIGPLFLLAPLFLISTNKEHRGFCSASVFIFGLGEFILFQPNPYDNNKLFYIAYLFICLLCADELLLYLKKLKTPALRRFLLTILLLLCTNSAILTLTREIISGLPGHSYMLFSRADTEAAEYITDNTDPDALFLTASNHNNTVAALTGRNILCGSASYLYYHGIDYQPTEQLQTAMLVDSDVFEANFRSLGIDYVYIGSNERSLGGTTPSWLSDNYPSVFSNSQVIIYDVREE